MDNGKTNADFCFVDFDKHVRETRNGRILHFSNFQGQAKKKTLEGQGKITN